MLRRLVFFAPVSFPGDRPLQQHLQMAAFQRNREKHFKFTDCSIIYSTQSKCDTDGNKLTKKLLTSFHNTSFEPMCELFFAVKQ